MLGTFQRCHDIGLAMIQELKTQKLNTIPYYTAHVNQGVEDRGTAILIKEGLTVSNLIRLPSARDIAAIFQGTYIINVYAPSGAEKRGGEDFYNNEVPKLRKHQLKPSWQETLTVY
jgi:exonuclease III